MAAPDVSGFLDALDRLRADLGTEVTFRIPVAAVWPSGTQLDPETGRPYDPTIDPISGGGYQDVVKTAALASVLIRRGAEAEIGGDVTGGIRRATNVAANVAAADHPDVAGATQFVVNGNNYKIVDWERDDSTRRWIAFGEAR